MQQFVEKAGIRSTTTPQGRGVVPEDHPLSFLANCARPRSRTLDLILILGTRMNYVIGHGSAPRFGGNAKIARHRHRRRRARHRAAQDRHSDPWRLQGGARSS
jgi:thiamine pyrophosphate-dependent acetolactate synthase large subunit-like protein